MGRIVVARVLCGISIGIALGCTQQGEESTSASATTGSGTTVSTGSSGPASTGTGTGSTASTGVVETSTGADSGSSGEDTTPSTTTGVPPMPRLCSLEAVDPSADVAAAVDEGDGVGQIPTVIGEVLVRNCACHYTDMVPPGYVDYISGHQPLATWADFHQLFTGTFPVGYEEMEAYLAVERRVVFSDPLPMPPFICGVEGEVGKRITDEDLALMTDWLAAGAPDGASWP